jgi:hypothetical protein
LELKTSDGQPPRAIDLSTRPLFVILAVLLTVAGCDSDDSNNGASGDVGTDIRQRDVGERDVADDSGAEDAEDGGADDVSDTTQDTREDAQDTVDAQPDASDAVDDSDARDVSGDAVADGDAGEAAPGDTCDVAVDVTAGGVFESQTTTGFNDDYSSDPTADNCPSGTASGPDVVYSVSPSSQTTYRFTVEPGGSTFDPFIYLRADCAQQACLAGTVLNGPGASESVEYTARAGETVFVIVDGELFSDGDFKLTVDVR